MVEPVTKPYYCSADALKFFLMPFVCFACFGLPGQIGNYIANLSRFTAPTFFVLCGFFSAISDDVGSLRTGKTLLRTGARFVYLAIILFLANIAFYTLGRGVSLKQLILALLTKRTLFDFFVLCTWPFNMGKSLWFVQSLFYVRFGLWLMKKLHLLRFYKLLMVLGFLAMLLTSEFASVVHFRFLGYDSFPANWLTCALPNMMLGRFVYEKREKLLSLPIWSFLITFALGTTLAFEEFTLLKYFGHLVQMGNTIGFCVMATSISCLFLRMTAMDETFFAAHGRMYSWGIYAMCQPVMLGLIILAYNISDPLLSAVQTWAGLVTYFVCLLIAFVFGYIMFWLDEYNDSELVKRWNRWLR